MMLYFCSPKMNSSYESLGPKYYWSEEDLSDLVCGVTVLSILLLMFCFFYVLCKIYSDEETIVSDEGMIALLHRNRRNRNRSKSSKNRISSEAKCEAPDNYPNVPTIV